LLKMTLRGFGVQEKNGKLEIIASAESFALRKHNLIQAILAVNDLFYLAEPITTNLFYEDVVLWLDLSDIRYTPKVKFTGISGYDNLFDFVIPKSRKYPERLLRTINNPTKEAAKAFAFSWIDTKDVRSTDSRAYAIINDAENGVQPSVISAMQSYDIYPALWSKRENIREELAS
jgi:hypothetical protein